MLIQDAELAPGVTGSLGLLVSCFNRVTVFEELNFIFHFILTNLTLATTVGVSELKSLSSHHYF